MDSVSGELSSDRAVVDLAGFVSRVAVEREGDQRVVDNCCNGGA
jgi:hypothetical protein